MLIAQLQAGRTILLPEGAILAALEEQARALLDRWRIGALLRQCRSDKYDKKQCGD